MKKGVRDRYVGVRGKPFQTHGVKTRRWSLLIPQEVTEATYEDFAGCVPQVSSGRHKLRFYDKLCNISKLCSK